MGVTWVETTPLSGRVIRRRTDAHFRQQNGVATALCDTRRARIEYTFVFEQGEIRSDVVPGSAEGTVRHSNPQENEGMSDARLSRRLEEVAIRLRRVRRQRSLTFGWILAAVATAVLIAGGLVGSSWLPMLLLPLVVLYILKQKRVDLPVPGAPKIAPMPRRSSR